MKRSKFDERWNEMLQHVLDYISCKFRFPSCNTVWKSENIGQWLRNQISLWKKGNLNEYRVRTLNYTIAGWNGTEAERNKTLDEVISSGCWKRFVPINEIPIDTLFEGDELRSYLQSEFFSLERVLEVADNDTKYKILSVLYPWISVFHCKLIMAIYCNDISNKECTHSFLSNVASRSKDETDSKVEFILSTLPEIEANVIKLRIDESRTLRDVARMFNLTVERIRQIEAKALRRLRHPSRLQIWYRTDTALDTLGIKPALKSQLYRAGITNENDLRRSFSEKIFSDSINMEIESLIEKTRLNHTREVSIDDLDLSVRSYNCLRRTGVRSIDNLIKLVETDGAAYNIRNLGRKSMEEVSDIIRNRYPHVEIRWDKAI